MNPPDSCPFCGADCAVALVQPGYQIVACRRCHIARTDPPPAPVPYEAEDFHASFPYRHPDDLPRLWRHGLQMQRRLLLRHVAPGARVLEIGCGQGLMLRLLADCGLQVTGIEPSKSAASYARAAGLNVVDGYFTRQSFTQPFAAVVVSHVLEHIEQPAAFLRDVAAVAPGGILLLVQANWRGWVPRKTKGLWHAWAPTHHYWHFTPAGLRRWLATLEIETLATEYSSLEHGTYWLARLARWFPGASDQFHLIGRLPQPATPTKA